jgi:hypothetical protein
MNITEEINIKTILFNKYNSLGKLCANIQKITLIDHITQQVLNKIIPDIAKYCRAGNLKDNCITIETTRSEYLTILRFQTQTLLYELRQYPELYKLITIKFKINPDLNNLINNLANNKAKQSSSKVNTLNQSAKTKLTEISESIVDIQLKAALLKLFKLK